MPATWIPNEQASYFLKNGLTLASFIIYFRSFQTNIITIFGTDKCNKCPSSMQGQDSNPRPKNLKTFLGQPFLNVEAFKTYDEFLMLFV